MKLCYFYGYKSNDLFLQTKYFCLFFVFMNKNIFICCSK